TPVIWRGPLVAGAVRQLLTQVDWGELDYLVCDLPPGTGDASLTLAQTVPLGGIVVVTTPQEAALNIAAKALAMFKRLDVPIIGVVENMSYFVCPHCGEKTAIFSSGGGRKIAAERGVDFLGEIPIAVSIREQSDRGAPVVAALPDSPEAVVYKELAFKVAGILSIVAWAKMSK
ncbi:MAG: P-loop NTPase, partial [Thaumarchaeota archaeon]|nr:P-loop NTPase [Nitrososphaerota archaeon]